MTPLEFLLTALLSWIAGYSLASSRRMTQTLEQEFDSLIRRSLRALDRWDPLDGAVLRARLEPYILREVTPTLAATVATIIAETMQDVRERIEATD